MHDSGPMRTQLIDPGGRMLKGFYFAPTCIGLLEHYFFEVVLLCFGVLWCASLMWLPVLHVGNISHNEWIYIFPDGNLRKRLFEIHAVRFDIQYFATHSFWCNTVTFRKTVFWSVGRSTLFLPRCACSSVGDMSEWTLDYYFESRRDLHG